MTSEIPLTDLQTRIKNRSALAEHEVKALLGHHEIPAPEGYIAFERKEAEAILERMGPPYALKVTSPEILHKTELKGVVIGLETKEALLEAYDEMAPRFPGKPLLIERMAPKGLEMIVGLIHDPQFGPTLMAGLGGIFAEVLEDVAFRVVPVDHRDCEELLGELKGGKVLAVEGFRGKFYDREKLLDLMVHMGGEFALQYGRHLQSMDLNPVFVYEQGQGVMVVDAKLVPMSCEEDHTSKDH